MILLVATPGRLPTKWRNLVQRAHREGFREYMTDAIDLYWWFVDIREGAVAGVAGAKRESDNDLFLGPCVVFEPFRGRGIQGEFIARREALGRSLDFKRAVTYTYYRNYASANNFIGRGYRLGAAWTNSLADDGTFCFWSKIL